MIREINIFIFSILALYSTGQDAFFIETVDSLNESYIGVCEVDDGYVAVGGREIIDTSSSSDSGDGILRMFDGQGKLVWSNQIDVYHFERYERAISVNNYIYTFGVKHDDNVISQQRTISKFSSTGDLLWTNVYGDTSAAFGGNRIESTLIFSDGFLVTGNNFKNGTSGNAGDVTKFDLNGNLVWHKTYEFSDTEPYNDWVKHVIDDGTGLTFLLHTQRSIAPYTIWTQTVIKTDYNGDEVWRKDVSDYQVPAEMQVANTGITISHIAPFKDGHVLLMKAVNEFSKVFKTYLVEFDQDGNEITAHSYLDSINYRTRNFVSTNDGGLAAIGFDWFGDPNDFPKHMIIKWSENLDFEWFARNGLEENLINWQMDGMQTSDGGYLISGDVFKSEPNNTRYDAILTKTDCRGNISWDYGSCSINTNNSELLVFPNPSASEFYFHLPNEKESLQLSIYDFKGRRVLETSFYDSSAAQINMIDFADGIYLYVLEADSNRFTGKISKNE